MRKNCPTKREEEGVKKLTEEIQEREAKSPYKAYHGGLPEKSYNGTTLIPPRGRTQKGSTGADNPSAKDFHERVDRHGNPFGGRVGTRQTRNPPPSARAELSLDSERQSWKNKPAQVELQAYNSPPYTKNREHTESMSQRSKDLFPQRSTSQWRPKLVKVIEGASYRTESQNQERPASENQLALVYGEKSYPKEPSKETVMEELHEVTRQYLSCPDPVEAAARRQRVHFSDANGLMEATAASILTAAATRANQRYPPLHIRDCDSNPVTPPPLNEGPCNDWLFPDPSTILSPGNGIEEDDGLEHFSKETSPTVETTPNAPKERSAKVRSIIVSPNSETQVIILRSQEPIVEPEGDI
ncbi:unnamed protein product, partial [Brassica rapa subsp. narinosa]